jgi:hypothetical protein
MDGVSFSSSPGFFHLRVGPLVFCIHRLDEYSSESDGEEDKAERKRRKRKQKLVWARTPQLNRALQRQVGFVSLSLSLTVLCVLAAFFFFHDPSGLVTSLACMLTNLLLLLPFPLSDSTRIWTQSLATRIRPSTWRACSRQPCVCRPIPICGSARSASTRTHAPRLESGPRIASPGRRNSSTGVAWALPHERSERARNSSQAVLCNIYHHRHP